MIIIPDYKKLYHKAFNGITEAEKLIAQASVILKITQQECEEIYMASAGDEPDED